MPRPASPTPIWASTACCSSCNNRSFSVAVPTFGKCCECSGLWERYGHGAAFPEAPSDRLAGYDLASVMHDLTDARYRGRVGLVHDFVLDQQPHSHHEASIC